MVLLIVGVHKMDRNYTISYWMSPDSTSVNLYMALVMTEISDISQILWYFAYFFITLSTEKVLGFFLK
jgi:hypothetical protein